MPLYYSKSAFVDNSDVLPVSPNVRKGRNPALSQLLLSPSEPKHHRHLFRILSTVRMVHSRAVNVSVNLGLMTHLW